MIRDAVKLATDRLTRAGVEDARQDAWLLLGHALRKERATLLAHGSDPLQADEQSLFHELVDRRARREPLAQIIGSKEFWSLDFEVTKDVLCPRPDSECLIEAALDHAAKGYREGSERARVLDLGTGSGCLLLALLAEWPAAEGVGVDVSSQALSIARSNARCLRLDDRTSWFCGDWGDALDERFELIISNPPYIATSEACGLAPEIQRFEPDLALFAGEDGLDAYHSLGPQLRRLLAPNGFAVLEVGLGQADPVENLLGDAGLKTIHRRPDLAGIDRCLIVEREDG